MKNLKKIALAAVAAFIGYNTLAAQNFVRDDGTIDWVNTGAAVSGGDLVDLGGRYGVVLADTASNSTGAVKTEGQFRFTRAVTNAIADGTAIFRSSATSVTDVASSGTYLGRSVGAVAVVTDLTNKFIVVDINAIDRNPSSGKNGNASVAAAITNLVIAVTNGRITSLTINGTSL